MKAFFVSLVIILAIIAAAMAASPALRSTIIEVVGSPKTVITLDETGSAAAVARVGEGVTSVTRGAATTTIQAARGAAVTVEETAITAGRTAVGGAAETMLPFAALWFLKEWGDEISTREEAEQLDQELIRLQSIYDNTHGCCFDMGQWRAKVLRECKLFWASDSLACAASAIQERMTWLRKALGLESAAKVTVINEDCPAGDLYVNNRLVTTLQKTTSKQFVMDPGHYTMKACATGTSNCGKSISVSLKLGTATYRIFQGRGCVPQALPTEERAQLEQSPLRSPPVYALQNTVPGTYNMGQDRSQAHSNAKNPYCGAAEKMAWYFVEFCRDPALAALSMQVENLDSIFSMTGGSQPINSLTWQMGVDKKCKDAPSPPDCLKLSLEERTQKLEDSITQEFASDRAGIFKDQARERWAQYNSKR